MKLLLLACAGGAIGAGARFLVNQCFAVRGLIAWPYATLTVNVVGGFLMGIVMTLVLERYQGWPELRVFAATGILGGLTTFSAFTFELHEMIASGGLADPKVIAYILASVIFSLLALYAGVHLARAVMA